MSEYDASPLDRRYLCMCQRESYRFNASLVGVTYELLYPSMYSFAVRSDPQLLKAGSSIPLQAECILFLF